MEQVPFFFRKKRKQNQKLKIETLVCFIFVGNTYWFGSRHVQKLVWPSTYSNRSERRFVSCQQNRNFDLYFKCGFHLGKRALWSSPWNGDLTAWTAGTAGVMISCWWPNACPHVCTWSGVVTRTDPWACAGIEIERFAIDRLKTASRNSTSSHSETTNEDHQDLQVSHHNHKHFSPGLLSHSRNTKSLRTHPSIIPRAEWPAAPDLDFLSISSSWALQKIWLRLRMW